MFAPTGRILGIELFDHKRTLCDKLPKLVRTYTPDVMKIASSAHDLPTKGGPKAFLNDVAPSDHAEHEAAGTGTDLSLTGKGVADVALMFHDRVVHLCAFLEEEDGNRGDRDQSRAAAHGRKDGFGDYDKGQRLGAAEDVVFGS